MNQPKPSEFPRWGDAKLAYLHSRISAPELTGVYLLDRAQQKAPTHFLQGTRPNPLPVRSSPALDIISRYKVYQVPETASKALCSWSLIPSSANVFFTSPSVETLLSLQATGVRCVSLLEEHDATQYNGGLSFAVHDLCHLGKFREPLHYAGQVGFFSVLDKASKTHEWTQLYERLGSSWKHDSDHIIADMNGSALFLWLTLTGKVRQWAEVHTLSIADSIELLLRAVSIPESLWEAAKEAKPHQGLHSTQMLQFFISIGETVLQSQNENVASTP